MSSAVAATLEGMPEPADLRLGEVEGRCVISVGARVLFDYDAGDTAMRNVALAVLRQLGFPGRRVAAVLGLTENYVATLHNAALRGGSAALIGQPRPGRPGKLSQADWAAAAAWREQGVSDAQIGRRLGVAHTTVARRLGPRQPPRDARPVAGTAAGGGQPRPERLFPQLNSEPGPRAEPEPGSSDAGGVSAAGSELVAVGGAEPTPVTGVAASAPVGGGRDADTLVAGGTRIVEGRFSCRYAGAMLLHAFGARVRTEAILAAGAQTRRSGELALLSATSTCFALGAATVEQFKHLTAACAGPLAGLAVLPDARTIRPRLATIAEASDPLAVQRMFAQAMLAADPVTSGVYYVDDHFVPYAGAKPVGKGWNNKRGRAEKGRADTYVTSHDGRAVCFVTGQPSGLVTTLPTALAELIKAVPPTTPIMLGFDRGGAYPQVFRHCRERGVHWVTYRRAPLSVPATLPVLTTITVNGKTRQLAWAEETVELTDYGDARQITLFERGQAALQVLTSDEQACPAAVLSFLKSRWREENFLKYAAANYGIDKICDYIADIQANTKIVDNPARKTANATIRRAEKALASARDDYATMLADPAIPAPTKNARLIPTAEKKITKAEQALAAAKAARDAIPAKLPANVIDPGAKVALLGTRRRGLQMVLRLLAHNAEHWLSSHLNAYLRDDDEYRAITRETIIRGLAGTITYTHTEITVELQQPDQPRVARALNLLLQEINATPPSMPGDRRPITYRLTQHPPAFNS